MAGFLFRVGLGVFFWGCIEVADHFMTDFSVHWLVSLIAGLILGFGGVEVLEAL